MYLKKESKQQKSFLKAISFVVVLSIFVSTMLTSFPVLANTLTEAPSVMNITTNGVANAKIYINPAYLDRNYVSYKEDNLSSTDYESITNPVKTVVDDTVDLVKRVSGATLEVVTSIPSSGNVIILAQPKLEKAITDKFSDDITWLSDIKGADYQYGDDGFAVRSEGEKIYIIALNDKGLQNGLYDFLEKNAEILFTRSDVNGGTVFIPKQTIKVTNYNYRDKSPFVYRGFGANGYGRNKADTWGYFGRDWGSSQFDIRNKSNIKPGAAHGYGGDYSTLRRMGLEPYLDAHCQDMWLQDNMTKEQFDQFVAANPKFFMTDAEGNPRTGYWSQFNPYSEELVPVLVDNMELYFKKHPDTKTIDLSLNDDGRFFIKDKETGVLLQEQPFTTDCGKTVTPDMLNYKSTVYFNFVNRVAKELQKRGYTKDKGYLICSYAYIYCEYAPDVTLDSMIAPTFAPLNADTHLPYFESPSNQGSYVNLEEWAAKSDNIVMYTYNPLGYEGFENKYTRPYAYAVQKDFQKYVSMGIKGVHPESTLDTPEAWSRPNDYLSGGHFKSWQMNEMYNWMVSKLMWNPNEDLEALKQKFCRIAYGDAADDMLKFYNLIETGYNMYDDFVWYATNSTTFIAKFMIESGIADEAIASLESAISKAATLSAKRKATLNHIYTVLKSEVQIYKTAAYENGLAPKATVSHDELIKIENLDFNNPIWNNCPPATLFSSFQVDKFVPFANFAEVRFQYDEKNLYVAYKVSDDGIGTTQESADAWLTQFSSANAAGTWWDKAPVYSETYITGNKRYMYDTMNCYFSTPRGQDTKVLYQKNINSPTPPSKMPAWEAYGKAVPGTPGAENKAERPMYYTLQVIPYETMGTTYEEADITANFIVGSVYGWCGNPVWSPAGFRQIVLEGKTIVDSNPKETLQKLYDECLKLNASDYTSDSFANFKTALDNAKVILEQVEPTKEDLRLALDNLRNAKKELVKIATEAEKAPLKAKIDEYLKIPNTFITAETYAVLRTELANANNILYKNQVTLKDLKLAEAALVQAYKNLVYYATPNEILTLQNSYNSNKDVVLGNYTQDSFNALQTALSNAKTILEQARPFKLDVLVAVDNLNVARKNLVVILSDKELLITTYNKYKDINADSYTDTASFELFTKALNNAKAVLDNVKASDKQVLSSAKALQVAYDGIKYNVPFGDKIVSFTDKSVEGTGLFKAIIDAQGSTATNPTLNTLSKNFNTNSGLTIKEFVYSGKSRATQSAGAKVVKDIEQAYVEIPFYGTGFTIEGNPWYYNTLYDIYVDGVLQPKTRFIISSTWDANSGYSPVTNYVEAAICAYGNNGAYGEYKHVNDTFKYKISNLKQGAHTLKIVPKRYNSALNDPNAISSGDSHIEFTIKQVVFHNEESKKAAPSLDKTALEYLYITNKDLSAEDYSEGFDGLTAALEAAKNILDKNDITIEEANEVLAIINAINPELLAQSNTVKGYLKNIMANSKEKDDATIFVEKMISYVNSANKDEMIAKVKATINKSNATAAEKTAATDVIDKFFNITAPEIARLKPIVFDAISNKVLLSDTDKLAVEALIAQYGGWANDIPYAKEALTMLNNDKAANYARNIKSLKAIFDQFVVVSSEKTKVYLAVGKLPVTTDAEVVAINALIDKSTATDAEKTALKAIVTGFNKKSAKGTYTPVRGRDIVSLNYVFDSQLAIPSVYDINLVKKFIIEKSMATDTDKETALNILNSNNFTAENIALLKSIVNMNTISTQEEIDVAKQNLQTAVDSLVHIPVTYNVNVSSSIGGVVSNVGDNVIAAGSDFTITITPDEGYAIVSLVVDGVSVNPANTFTIVGIDSVHNISVYFGKIETITPPTFDANDPFYALCEHIFQYDAVSHEHKCIKCGFVEITYLNLSIAKLEQQIDVLEVQLKALVKNPFRNRHEIKNVLAQIHELNKQIIDIRFTIVKLKVECFKYQLPCLNKK